MKNGLLQYKRGFTLLQLTELLTGHGPEPSTENATEIISTQMKALDITEIYLPYLAIHPEDFEKMPMEVFSNIPLFIDRTIGVGFTLETIQWLKSNVHFKNPTNGQYLQRKIGDNSLYLLISKNECENKEEITSFKMGRGSHEHVDTNMLKIEVSIDDMNPEFYGFLVGQLLQLGANDVYIEPVFMKKNRPGNILQILCQEEKKEEIIAFLFRETTTLGIRYTPYTVYRLEREFISLTTPWGEAKIKIGKRKGKVVQLAPEFDQCVILAKENNVPLKVVYDHLKEWGYQWLANQKE